MEKTLSVKIGASDEVLKDNARMPCKLLHDEGSFDSPYNQLSKITMQRVLEL